MAVTMGYGLLKWSSFFVFCPLSHFLKMTASKSLASLKKKNQTMCEVQRNKIMSVSLLNFPSAILQLSQF